MGKIIDLETRKEEEKKRRTEQERIKKMHTVLQMFQCLHCRFKCEKCGTQLEMEGIASGSDRIPYRFCRNCLDEFLEFQKRLHGCSSLEYYWYNDEWIDTWKSWIVYQDALKRYEKSNGYRMLLEEISRE